jgi:hypothetical protein
MLVAIIGPNLPDQSNGDFHVHAASCSDVHKYHKLLVDIVEINSLQDIVENVYCDIIADNDGNWQDYVNDFHFLPCFDKMEIK